MDRQVFIRSRSNYALVEKYINFNMSTEGYLRQEGSTCPICQRLWSKCIGHRLAYILPFYYINPLFADILVKFLNSICLTLVGGCMRSIKVYDGSESISATYTSSAKMTTCPYCKNKNTSDFSTNDKYALLYLKNPIDMQSFLEYIRESEHYGNYVNSYQAYFKEDPLSYVSNVLIIPPSVLRARIDNKNVDYDTKLILQIEKYLRELDVSDKNVSFIKTGSKDNKLTALAYLIGKWYASESPLNPSEATLFQQLATKEGIIRNKITSTRADNSMRGTVIPSSTEYGSAMIAGKAKSMLIHEKANNINLGSIRDACSAGEVKWIKIKGDDRWTRMRDTYVINIGDEICRMYRDGDVIFFNRQPTLTRRSYMSQHVYFDMESSTTAVHPINTVAYNADHDGDDMNAIGPMHFKSYVEAISLMHSINAIKGSNMGILFHELAVMLIISRRAMANETIPKSQLPLYKEAVNKYMTNNKLKQLQELHTYKDLISCIIPSTVNLDTGRIRIKNGVYIYGKLDKSTIGAGGTLLTYIINNYNAKVVALFMQDVMEICKVYMRCNHIGLKMTDMRFADNGIKAIHDISLHAQRSIAKQILLLDKATSSHEQVQVERNISLLSERPGLKTEQVLAHMTSDPDNMFITMLESGARGNKKSAKQLIAQVALQYVGGVRFNAKELPYILYDGTITLASHGGYVDGSFSRGLGPVGAFIHSASCRDAVVRGKLSISAAGEASQKLYTLLSTCSISSDLSTVIKGKQVLWGSGTLINTADITDRMFDIKHIFNECL